jgi:hypothetical protein
MMRRGGRRGEGECDEGEKVEGEKENVMKGR